MTNIRKKSSCSSCNFRSPLLSSVIQSTSSQPKNAINLLCIYWMDHVDLCCFLSNPRVEGIGRHQAASGRATPNKVEMHVVIHPILRKRSLNCRIFDRQLDRRAAKALNLFSVVINKNIWISMKKSKIKMCYYWFSYFIWETFVRLWQF